MAYWLTDLKVKIESNIVYFGNSVAHTIPAVLVLVVKPNEDCFTCFNRCAPARYSYFQYTVATLLTKRISFD